MDSWDEGHIIAREATLLDALKALVAVEPACERGQDANCHHCGDLPLFDKQTKRWEIAHWPDCPWLAAKKLVMEA